MTVSVKGQFNYCPSHSTFSTRAEKGLKALLNVETSTFNGMLSKSNHIHVKNIQKNFTKRHCDRNNLPNCGVTLSPNFKTKNCGTSRIAYKATQLWSTLPTRYKNLSSLDLCKSEINNWHCSNCPCNSCRIFVVELGFISWNWGQLPRGVLINR